MGVWAAFVDTGPANTGAADTLVGVQSDKSSYTLDKECGRTTKSIRFTHRGLSLSGVTKAGYNQGPTVYCGVPSPRFRPLPHRPRQLRQARHRDDDGLGQAQEVIAAS
jgi:hypothetical protein